MIGLITAALCAALGIWLFWLCLISVQIRRFLLPILGITIAVAVIAYLLHAMPNDLVGYTIGLGVLIIGLVLRKLG